ncbi:hypothetical protein E4U13_006984 [Claviceps humidiphila]|uniref:Uncharacterized protein n=1 Tax=Claviceps humidiphila TaxID=1294629 RepID=A0A9P7PWU9_9HYPO|nr:hypothetical protein E4U13_006984 [Claviceps humidiphila]
MTSLYGEGRRHLSDESLSARGPQDDDQDIRHLHAFESVDDDYDDFQDFDYDYGYDMDDVDMNNDKDTEDDSMVRNRPLGLQHIRHVVRLFQCRRCHKPFRNPVTLPCGQSLCKSCIPETHVRSSITYPSMPDRLQGFRCPFDECSKVHALSDCSLDVVLNKVSLVMEQELERARLAASDSSVQTGMKLLNPWQVAAVPSLQDSDADMRLLPGGRLISTWDLARDGGLSIDTEVVYTDGPSSELDGGSSIGSDTDSRTADLWSLARLQTLARHEMDCQVCYALFHDPFTTGCGHTFCRPCLHRTLDHSHRCPICRRTLATNPLLNPQPCPSNGTIVRLTETCWPQEKLAREEAAAAEIAARHQDLDMPLFVCTLAFPAMPTFLHIFEPRYRLMIRRALEGNKTFGMVLPKRPRDSDDQHFHSFGTLLRIIDAQFYPDGRSLVETVGLTRFRVVRYGELDGYTVAKTERIDDVSLEEEEAIEAAEATGRAHDHETFTTLAATTSSTSTSTTATAVTCCETLEHDHDNGHANVPLEGTASTTTTINSHGMNSSPHHEDASQIPPHHIGSVTASELHTMSTQALMRFATEFVTRMRSKSVPWLTERMLAIYGECPHDPALFPWWLASMLPVRDLEKYRLLATSSVRERLKICCLWIVEWETKKWSPHHCVIL